MMGTGSWLVVVEGKRASDLAITTIQINFGNIVYIDFLDHSLSISSGYGAWTINGPSVLHILSGPILCMDFQEAHQIILSIAELLMEFQNFLIAPNEVP